MHNPAMTASACRVGRLIFLFAYIKMSHKAEVVEKSGGFPRRDQKTVVPSFDDTGFPKLHWTLVRKLTVAGDRVQIRFYTWGEVREAAYTMDQFLSVYRSFVSANPS
jgi:hypothetical protein